MAQGFTPSHSSTVNQDQLSLRARQQLQRAQQADTRQRPIQTRSGTHPPLGQIGSVLDAVPQDEQPQHSDQPGVEAAADIQVDLVDLGDQADDEDLDEASSLPANVNIAAGSENIYDSDQEAEVNSVEQQFAFHVIALKATVEYLQTFDASRYLSTDDAAGVLSNIAQDARHTAITIAAANHFRLYKVFRDHHGLEMSSVIINNLVPNFKIVVRAIVDDPEVDRAIADEVMARFKILTAYQRVACRSFADLIKFRAPDAHSLDEAVSTASDTAFSVSTSYTAQRGSFQRNIYLWISDYALTSQQYLTDAITKEIYEDKIKSLHAQRTAWEKFHIDNLKVMWQKSRERNRILRDRAFSALQSQNYPARTADDNSDVEERIPPNQLGAVPKHTVVSQPGVKEVQFSTVPPITKVYTPGNMTKSFSANQQGQHSLSASNQLLSSIVFPSPTSGETNAHAHVGNSGAVSSGAGGNSFSVNSGSFHNPGIFGTQPRNQRAGPQDTRFSGGPSASYRRHGNAVPPPNHQSTGVQHSQVGNHHTDMSDAVRNASLENIAEVSKNLLQMQINQIEQNSTRNSEGSEYRDSALPGNAKNNFYASLPAPWNVQPDTSGKYSDEYSRMTKFIKDAGREGEQLVKFNGDENIYFIWRPLVIPAIHQRNVSIKDKYNTLLRTLKRNSDSLVDGLLNITEPTPENYRNLIEQLEMHYGGADRAYNHAMKRLDNLRRFDANNFSLVIDYHSAICQFISFCTANNLAHCINAGQMVNSILYKLFDQNQLATILDYCGSHSIRDPPGSMFQVQSYLKQLTQYAEKARAMLGLQRKPTYSDRRYTRPRYSYSGTSTRQARVHRAKLGKGDDPDSDDSDSQTHSSGPNSQLDPLPEEDEEFDYYPMDNLYYHEGNDSGSESDGENDDDSSYLNSLQDPVCDGDIVNDRQYKAMVAKKFDFKECPMCKPQTHLLFMCPKFKALDMEDRFKYVEKGRRCYNCLGIGHGARICTLNNRCYNCKRKHHSLLCPKNAKSDKDKAFVEQFLTRTRFHYDSDEKSGPSPRQFGNRRQMRSPAKARWNPPGNRNKQVRFQTDRK